MNVHKAITNHVNKVNVRVKKFQALDQQREFIIEEAIALCKNEYPFTVDNINAVTEQINELAKQGTIPTRKIVTIIMVQDFVKKENSLS